MNHKEAKRLGQQLRQRRMTLGLSTRAVASQASVAASTLWRLEQGTTASPDFNSMVRLASVLGFNAPDIFALAGFTDPSELPSYLPYLRAKYPQLPHLVVEELARSFGRMASPYGYSAISS